MVRYCRRNAALLGCIDSAPMNRHRNHPVYDAASRGDLPAVRRMVDADPTLLDATHADGWNALMYAATGGHRDVVRQLLDKGAAVDHRDDSDTTALYWAAHRGHASVVELLLERGADPSATRLYRRTPLMAASYQGFDDVVHVLLRHSRTEVDAVDASGLSALWDACCGGWEGVVRQLLGAGADATRRVDDAGHTALHAAARRRHPGCVYLLKCWERAYDLSKARRIRDGSLFQNRTFLETASAGNPRSTLPTVSVVPVAPQESVGSKRGREGEEEDGSAEAGVAGPAKTARTESGGVAAAVVRNVVESLKGELFVELMHALEPHEHDAETSQVMMIK